MKMLSKLAFLATALAFAAPGQSATVDVSVVGTLDQVKGSTYIQDPTLENENAFIQKILGDEYMLTGKYEGIAESGLWKTVTGDNFDDSYAINFGDLSCNEGTCSTSPDYFVLKLGTGRPDPNKPNTFLFANNDSKLWAYIRLAQFEGVTDMNIGRVSHIAVGSGVAVPEPGTMGLLGLGLLGLAAVGRRRLKA
jgi:hypothetical protein